MSDEMECMCLQCGISNHIEMASISLEILDGSDVKVIKDIFCAECGGPLIILGKAGDRPHYSL